MRALRSMLAGALIAALVAVPTIAAADGGAYIEFEHTYAMPGDVTDGYAQVYVPERKHAILERGPFYAYLLSEGSAIREGRPLPAGAIRLGMFTIREFEPEWYRLEVAFTVPDLPGDFYTVMTCNDPCTVSGFREPLTGVLSIVGTQREARLLTAQGKLRARVGSARRDLRKSLRANEDLNAASTAREEERAGLIAQTDQLRGQLAALRAADRRRRPIVPEAGAWALAIALVALATAIVVRRRRRHETVIVDDAPGPLERELEQPRTR